MAEFAFKVALVHEAKKSFSIVSDASDSRGHLDKSVVELRRPDGSVLRVRSWYEFPYRGLEAKGESPYCFGIDGVDIEGREIRKGDLPPDTEVWLLGRHESGASDVATGAANVKET
jgi:hypothetical protein